MRLTGLPLRHAAAASAVAALVAVVSLAVFPTTAHPGALESVARSAGVGVAALGLLLAPGLLLLGRRRALEAPLLGLLPLPGMVVLAGAGLVIWALAGIADSHWVAAALSALIAIAIAVWAMRSSGETLITVEMQAALLMVVALVVLAAGRSLWSPDVPGDLAGGTVWRTLETSELPDSVIPYHVIQLIAHGTYPFTEEGQHNFRPTSFSDRPPLSALAVAPVVLPAATQVPRVGPSEPWQPFDPQGFSAYRIAMAALASVLLLSVYGVAAQLAGVRAALIALAAAAGAPFTAHEVLFTWPKLATAGLVLAAALLVLRRRPLSGGLVLGLAYLTHPLALLWAPPLVLLAAMTGPRRLRAGAATGLAALAAVVVWRLVNIPEYHQDNFLGFALQAYARPATGLLDWVSGRVQSLSITLLPGFLFWFHAYDPRIDPVAGHSPRVVLWFLQYWTTLPFAVGILFSPFLLVRAIRAARRRPVLALIGLALPFALFTVYWGSYTSAMMRAGLHPLFLSLAVAFGCAASRLGLLERLAILSRAPETALLLLLPAARASHRWTEPGRLGTDIAGLLLLLLAVSMLAFLCWRAVSAAGSERLPVLSRPEPLVEAERSG